MTDTAKKISYVLAVILMLNILTLTCFAQAGTVVVDFARIGKANMEDMGALIEMLDDSEPENNALWRKMFWLEHDKLYISNSFDVLSPSERIDAVAEFYVALRDSNIPAETKQCIYTGINNHIGSDIATAVPAVVDATKPDMASAISFWNAMPFQGIIGWVLGVVVVLIVLMTIIMTIIDLLYITNPSAIDWLLKAGEDKLGKSWLISNDAEFVAREAALGNATGNLMSAYFKRRFISIIVLAVCILYLLSGQIGTLISGLFDLVSGIVGT